LACLGRRQPLHLDLPACGSPARRPEGSRQRPASSIDVDLGAASWELDPAEQALANLEAAALLEKCLAHLGDPRDQRVVLLLSEGCTQAEIAARLSLTPQRVSQLVRRVRAHLSAHLKEYL
jgi:RNA polymerase sigma factor (sigma-70 family)